MAFGNTPICSNSGGPKEFIDPEVGALVDGTYTICKSQDSAFPDMFTGRECWFQPNEKQTKEHMRNYYEDWLKNPIAPKRGAAVKGMGIAESFSYNKIGEQMKELLV